LRHVIRPVYMDFSLLTSWITHGILMYVGVVQLMTLDDQICFLLRLRLGKYIGIKSTIRRW